MSQADQNPVDSPFSRDSTGADVLEGRDLSGKIALVTGGYSGIGLETTRALVEHGATVVIPVRSPEKASEALAGIDGDVRTATADLARLHTVRAFADGVLDEVDRLDLLINNAGIMASPERRVGPGWESQFGINHMGHFALTVALLPLLRRTEGARVVALSSTGHKMSDVVWDDIHFEDRAYDKWDAYGQAKTANALFANALSRRLHPGAGSAFSVHPGGIWTPLQRHLDEEEMIALGWLGDDGEPSELAREAFKSPEQGCATTLWAATSSQLDGTPGVYCEDCDIAAPSTTYEGELVRYMGVDAHACDDEAAERLWTISEAFLAEA